MRVDLFLLGLALVAIFAGLSRHRKAPRSIERVMPATATCANCDETVAVMRNGRCGVCGSSSVVVSWSYGARLVLRDQRRHDRGRFLRGGTPERRKA